MTVAELIEKLKTFDPTLPVVTPGFDEFGYDNVGTVDVVELVKVVNPGSHCPAFEDSSRRQMNMESPVGTPFKALAINW